MAYGKVEDGFWNDRLIRALPELTRYFMLYLLTCSHRNRLGCYVLDPHYAAADLKWTAEQVEKQLDELAGRDRIGWDPDNRVVLVKRFLKHNTMENQNVVKGSIVDLRSLPPTSLLPELLELVEKYKRPHYHLIIEALGNRLANDYPNGSEIITQTNGTGPDLTGPDLTRPSEDKSSEASLDAEIPKSDPWDEFAAWFRTEGHKLEWMGDAPPIWAPTDWTIERSLSIWRNFYDQGEELDVIRKVIEQTQQATTAAYFWGKGKRNRWNAAAGKARQALELEGQRVGEVIKRLSA